MGGTLFKQLICHLDTVFIGAVQLLQQRGELCDKPSNFVVLLVVLAVLDVVPPQNLQPRTESRSQARRLRRRKSTRSHNARC